MGFQGVGAGGMGNSDAALITQMRSVVESTLVDEDAKLNLVKDYGSDRTVSHRGSWSVFSPLVNSRRIQEIRTAFAEALNSMTGRVDGGSTGNPELDSIIDQLKTSSKPLTKREVRRVLDKAERFLDLAELKQELESSRASGMELQKKGGDLFAKVDALTKNLLDAKVRFSEEEIKGFQAKYVEAQRLRAQVTEDYNRAFGSKSKGKLTHRQVLAKLDGVKDVPAAGEQGEGRDTPTFQALSVERKKLWAQLKQLPVNEKGEKDAKTTNEIKDKCRAIAVEMKRILLTREQQAEELEQSIPMEVRDQLAVKDDCQREEEQWAEFVSLVEKTFKDDLNGQKLTSKQAVEFVNREKQKGDLPTEKAEKLEKFASLAQKIVGSRSAPAREAIARGKVHEPDLSQFMLAPGEKPKEEGGDIAVGLDAFNLRAKLLTEIVALKEELKDWSSAPKAVEDRANELLGQMPDPSDKSYAQENWQLQESLQGCTERFENLQKKLNNLLSRYNETFVTLKPTEEKTLKPEEKLGENQAPKNVKNKEEKIVEHQEPKNVAKVNNQPAELKFPQGVGIVFDQGVFHISSEWVKSPNMLSSAKEAAITTNILDKIEGFDEWFAGDCKQNLCNTLGIDGLAKEYLEDKWGDYSKKAVIAEALRKVLAERDLSKPLQIAEMKELVQAAMSSKLITEGVVDIGPAEAKLKKLTEEKDNANPALDQLRKDFDDWKKKELDSVKTVFGEEVFGNLKTVIEEEYGRLEKAVSEKSLRSLAFGSDEDKTIFNHMVSFLVDRENDGKPLFDVIKQDLETDIGSYKLVDEGAKNIKPKLTMPPNAKEDPRVVQDDETSPQKLIQSLLKKDPPVGLVQKGGLSCWMISVVNGLLATKGGREILEKCFRNPDECVFNALTKEGETKTIKVSSAEIAEVMGRNAGVSQLEAAIWKGVYKMANEVSEFDVKGCDLGAMGEATDVATLFGLRNAEMGVGRTVNDDNYSWVTGANAIQKDKVVVLHARRDNNYKSGHFVTAIGTKFNDQGLIQGQAPEKTFLIHDSLSSWNTQTLKSDELNVKGTNKDLSQYEVLAYEIPA